MRKPENHSRVKTSAVDTLLKALSCLGKILRIVYAIRHLG